MNIHLNTQKVAVFHRFGSPEVVVLEETPIPQIQGKEILVKIHFSTVNSADCRIRSRNVPRGFGFILGLIYGFKEPKKKILGLEASGEVVAKGSQVQNFSIGDRVVLNLGFGMGGHQEFVAINEDKQVIKLPENVSYEKAVAAVFGAGTALLYLRDKIKLKADQQILITGAGGAVGSAAVQLALAMGARVTAVCSSDKVAWVQKLGAHKVINYQTTNWLALSEKFDVIFDSVGVCSIGNTLPLLNLNGKVAFLVADLPLNLKCVWYSLKHSQKFYAGAIDPKKEDIEYLIQEISSGRLNPLIGQVFPFGNIVEAHRLAESGHKLGSVLLKMI
ncbi:MAG: zinc-binding alcohol dehydrogenase family protein [Bdellovibrionia bacterium]